MCMFVKNKNKKSCQKKKKGLAKLLYNLVHYNIQSQLYTQNWVSRNKKHVVASQKVVNYKVVDQEYHSPRPKRVLKLTPRH